jgi:hypothetical protein
MNKIKDLIKKNDTLMKIIDKAGFYKRLSHFPGTKKYWDTRYNNDGTSGAGSYNNLAEFKAEILNSFVDEHGIKTVMEFGCGDGNQLQYARYPNYVGLDISSKAVRVCEQKFKNDTSKKFFIYKPDKFNPRILSAELTLSLDVIYHLVEDMLFAIHLKHLFDCSQRYVIIYSSNSDVPTHAPHIRHRCFTDWISEHIDNFKLEKMIKNRFPFDPEHADTTSISDFYIYKKK